MTIDENRRRYEQAREQGRQARRAGRKLKDNPYRLGSSSDQHYAWAEGHGEAERDMRARR